MAVDGRMLRRSREHKVIGGVCGGVGEYLGIDPVILRIGFAVAMVMFGSGFLLYAILWLVIPLAPRQGEDPLEQNPRFRGAYNDRPPVDVTPPRGKNNKDDWSDF